MEYGLIGRKLGHSFSPYIHSQLGNYPYELKELPARDLEDFLRKGDFQGVNITVPYKRRAAVICDKLSDIAKRSNAVNLILCRPDGSLYGENTDYGGFLALARRNQISFREKKIAIFGSGGAAHTVAAAVKDAGAREIALVSRKSPITFTDIASYGDADILVNATPVGMWPKNGERLINLDDFPRCSGVLDLVYNPQRTALVFDARERDIPAAGGLFMLVEQARLIGEAFLGTSIPKQRSEEIYARTSSHMGNIVLVGMPGSGKSTLAKIIAKETGRAIVDTDILIYKRYGRRPAEIIMDQGEAAFRRLESEVIAAAGKHWHSVIATGGGCVLKPQNYRALKQNGTIFFVDKDYRRLTRKNRPLSKDPQALKTMAKQRRPLYKQYSDHTVTNDSSLKELASTILNIYQGGIAR